MLRLLPLLPPPPRRYVDLEALPRDVSGALSLRDLDFHSGSRTLPLAKLIDDFSVGRGGAGRGEEG